MAAMKENVDHIELGNTKEPPMETLRVPIPSNDPNDPLNWSSLEKISTYLTICLFTWIANVNSSNFTVAVVPVTKEFKTTTTRAGYLVCFNVLLFGVGNIFWVPLMRKIGKRPVYLMALALLCAFNGWSLHAKTYNSLLASRILSGFAASAADATVPAVVTDLFFASNRGHCMMAFHLALSSGLFLGPLINAFLVQEKSWRWSCGFICIFTGCLFLLGIFTIRETTYLKPRDEIQDPVPKKKSFVQWLSLSAGYNPRASIKGTILDIICMVPYPPVLWTGFIIGIFVGWNIVVQLTSAQTFVKPPYSWKLGSLGLLSISGWVGAVLAFYVGGRLIDLIAKRAATKANSSAPQPQARLLALFIPGIIGPMGILIFGLCIAHKTAWIGPAFGYGMQGFGLTALSNIAVTYAVDCYHQLPGEALVTIFIIRNTIGVLLALYSADWVKESGPTHAFGEMVAIQYVFLLFAIPLYRYSNGILAMSRKWRPMSRFA